MKRSGIRVTGMMAAVLLAGMAVGAQNLGRETFTGMLVQVPGSTSSATGTLRINVNRWSSTEERRALQVALQEGGQDALMKAMNKVNLGGVRFPQGTSWQVRFATSSVIDGVRVVRIATDRPIAFAEAWEAMPSKDYPFGLIELKIPPDGEGTGVVYGAAALSVNDEGQLVINWYGRLRQQVKSVRAMPAGSR